MEASQQSGRALDRLDRPRFELCLVEAQCLALGDRAVELRGIHNPPSLNQGWLIVRDERRPTATRFAAQAVGEGAKANGATRVSGLQGDQRDEVKGDGDADSRSAMTTSWIRSGAGMSRS
jgi:hypothetical protein